MFSFWNWWLTVWLLAALTSAMWFFFTDTNSSSRYQPTNVWTSILAFFLVYHLFTATDVLTALMFTVMIPIHLCWESSLFKKTATYMAYPTVLIMSLLAKTHSLLPAMVLLETASMTTTGFMMYFMAMKNNKTGVGATVTPTVLTNYIMYLLLTASTIIFLTNPTTAATGTIFKFLVSSLVMLKMLITPFTLVKSPVYSVLTPAKIATLTLLHTLIVTPLSLLYLQMALGPAQVPALVVTSAALVVITGTLLSFSNMKQILVLTTPMFMTTITAFFM